MQERPESDEGNERNFNVKLPKKSVKIAHKTPNLMMRAPMNLPDLPFQKTAVSSAITQVNSRTMSSLLPKIVL